MEATNFSFPQLPAACRFKSPRQRRRQLVNLTVAAASGGGEMKERDYWGRVVDENMIVLRLRVRQMKMLEMNYEPPSNWMPWEKQYLARYNEDVCEALGLLQSYLMNVRPCLALGMAALVTLSVLISTGMAFFHAVEIAKRILTTGVHLT